MTVINGGKVVGYVTFELTNDNKTDVRLTDDGSYVISLEKNAAGVKLDLVLNEENGVIEPTDVETIEKSLWWLWIILILCVILSSHSLLFISRRRPKTKNRPSRSVLYFRIVDFDFHL